MSIGAITLVFRLNREPTQKLVLLALADWCDVKGESLHPSMRAIALKASISESQARRIVHQLIDDKLLKVVGNANGGAPGTTRQYRLRLDLIERQIKKQASNRAGADATPRTDASPTPSVPASPPTPSTHARDGSHPCAERASAHATQTVIDPSITTKEAATSAAPPNPLEKIFGSGVDLLKNFGSSEAGARSFLGKLVSNHGETPVAEKIAWLAANPKVEPKSYLTKMLQPKEREMTL